MILNSVEVIIPARLQSSRMPGKLLRADTGKTVLQHTYEAVSGIIGKPAWVATDSTEIMRAVDSFGGQVISTSDHRCGTNRVAEAAIKLKDIIKLKAGLIVNVQGDEPEISRDSIFSLLAAAVAQPDIDIATVAVAFPDDSRDNITNPNQVKVVCCSSGRALYFSRAPIPYQQPGGQRAPALRHLGIYCYTMWALSLISKLEPGPLSKAENLEQLSWLEAGFRIMVGLVDEAHPGIDTEDDYLAFLARYNNRHQGGHKGRV